MEMLCLSEKEASKKLDSVMKMLADCAEALATLSPIVDRVYVKGVQELELGISEVRKQIHDFNGAMAKHMAEQDLVSVVKGGMTYEKARNIGLQMYHEARDRKESVVGGEVNSITKNLLRGVVSGSEASRAVARILRREKGDAYVS